MLSRTIPCLAPLRAYRRNAWCGSSKYPLSPELDESESLQMLVANLRGRIGFRACRCDLSHRIAHALPYRGRQKGVDVTRMRPSEYDCHAGDLSAFVDLVSHGYKEVGTGRKQRVQVGHHAVLPDEAMGPVEVGVPRASHHLAFAVNAGRYGGKISRQSAEVCQYVVLPKRAKLGCVVSTADCPYNLASVVIAVRNSAGSEVRKQGDSFVFPRYGVNRRTAAGSRVAYGLASIVDPKCVPVWIATRRKSLGFIYPMVALFPQHRQLNPIISCPRRACGVHDAVFRKSYDLSTVIDRARLPVIPAERREGAHVGKLPKKREASVVCAEAANVFPVRVWDIGFGIAYYLSEVVDLAPVHPTVRSSERAEVEFESVDVDQCVSV